MSVGGKGCERCQGTGAIRVPDAPGCMRLPCPHCQESEPPVDLAAERERRAAAGGAAAHAKGEAFAFVDRSDLGDESAPIGWSEGLVTILLDEQALTGIAFTPEAARKVAVFLIECAHDAEMKVTL